MNKAQQFIRNRLFSMRTLLLVYATTVTVLVITVWWQADQIMRLPPPAIGLDSNVTGQVTGAATDSLASVSPQQAQGSAEDPFGSGTVTAEAYTETEPAQAGWDDPSQLPQALSLSDFQSRRQPLIWPVERVEIITAYGRYMSPTLLDWRHHSGLDLAASEGTSVKAVLAGVVFDICEDDGLGRIITLDHGGGLQSRYANLGQLRVELGEQVGQGQFIAEVGRTARYESAEEAHLHWEIWQNGMSVDPLSFIEQIE